MNISEKNEPFLTLNSIVIYSGIFSFFFILMFAIMSSVKPNISELFIYKPYFLLDRSFGGYVISYFWIFLDLFTIQIFILLGHKSFIFAKAKYDSSQIH